MAVFREIYWVFLVLGTLVGVVVIAYMVYNAYRYRDDGDRDDGFDAPTLGELPSGSGGGRKLFLSFSLSAVIVVSLIAWTYGTLLYVEQDSPVDNGDHVEVDVEGYQFGWQFTYADGYQEDGTLHVPVDTAVRLNVTSRDVFHTFGAPGLRVKTDAIPGQTTDTWFVADETGEYEIQCYELCGTGHSLMTGTVVVMEPDEYQEWYSEAGEESEPTEESEDASASNDSAAIAA